LSTVKLAAARSQQNGPAITSISSSAAGGARLKLIATMFVTASASLDFGQRQELACAGRFGLTSLWD